MAGIRMPIFGDGEGEDIYEHSDIWDKKIFRYKESGTLF
jgi:hypothetical protein